jgi:hypothetical protein
LYFQATDETWRWRRRTGVGLHDAYWVQVVRMLAPTRHGNRDPRLTLSADPAVTEVGRRVMLRARVPDADLLATLTDRLALIVRDRDQQPIARVTAERSGPGSALFEAAWTPLMPGTYEVTVDDVDPPDGREAAVIRLRAKDASLERRRLDADPDAMARLAHMTGGSVGDLNRLGELIATIEDRSVRVPDDIREPLWRNRLAWIAFVALISVEWGLRKGWGLL